MDSKDIISVLNPLISATIDVIQDMCGVSAKRNGISKKYNSIISSGVSTVLGLTGKFKGRIILDTSIPTAKALAEKISEESIEEINEEVLYTMIELNNIISGKAMTVINNANKEYNFRLSPPGIFWGEEIKISSPGLQVFNVEIETDVGMFYINLGFEGVEI